MSRDDGAESSGSRGVVRGRDPSRDETESSNKKTKQDDPAVDCHNNFTPASAGAADEVSDNNTTRVPHASRERKKKV